MADGKGCKCEARSECECGCDADWTPQEVYDLRTENKQLKEAIRRLADQDATLSVQGGNVIVEMDSTLTLAERTVLAATMSDENERSVASAGSVAGEPAAWGVLRVGGRWVSILDNEVQAETSRKYFDKMENWVHEVVPLYRSPTLTDAEREAVELAIDCMNGVEDIRALWSQRETEAIATLRGLFDRTK